MHCVHVRPLLVLLSHTTGTYGNVIRAHYFPVAFEYLRFSYFLSSHSLVYNHIIAAYIVDATCMTMVLQMFQIISESIADCGFGDACGLEWYMYMMDG